MTSTELERFVQEKLGRASLSQVIDEHNSQFLEFPDGLFAELVLNDATKLVDVERIARETREALRRQGVQLDVIVRVLWSVSDVRHVGKSLSVTAGAFRDAEAFMATLVSGGARTAVEVDVTSTAWEEIEGELERSPKTSASVVEWVTEVVKRFLELRLSLGGASYWEVSTDPNHPSRLDLGPGEVAYLLGRSPVPQKG